MLGPGEGLGEHPVIGGADAVHPLPDLVGLRHGTGGKALVLHAGAAGILQGLHSLGGLSLGHLGVILAVVGPDRGVLDGLKGAGDVVPLGRHHAAHGDGSSKVVGVGQDHVPDTGTAHGHTLDVDTVRVDAVGSHIAVDSRLQGRNGVRVGPVLAGALGCKQVGGVLLDHFVRNVEGGTVVGGKLGAVGAHTVLTVEENDQGQLSLQGRGVTARVVGIVLHSGSTAGLETLGQRIAVGAVHLDQTVLVGVLGKGDATGAQHTGNSCKGGGATHKVTSAQFHGLFSFS